MPILEGIDGVQKMSKSLGNAIGIKEPPIEMYGKLMSISDELMWRYYTLLTDLQTPQIEELKSNVASGVLHPMQAKKDLARRIVADFHSEHAAREAEENWEKQFQKHEIPKELEVAVVSLNSIGIERRKSGLAFRCTSYALTSYSELLDWLTQVLTPSARSSKGQFASVED